MSGELVTDPQQFENGAYYIAVGADIGGLKLMNYGQQRPDFHTSPKAQRKSVHTPQQRAASNRFCDVLHEVISVHCLPLVLSIAAGVCVVGSLSTTYYLKQIYVIISSR